MSESVFIKDSTIRIPAEKLGEAATLLRTYLEIENSGSSDGEAVLAAFDGLYFDGSLEPDGSFTLSYYDGSGNPEHLNVLRLLAGVIISGSYLVWADEDGVFERWLIEDGKLREQLPTTIWQDA